MTNLLSMSESNHRNYYTNDQSSDAESFESMKSFKIFMNERLDKMEKNILNKLDKIIEMLSANKIVDAEFDGRKHEVSSLDNEPSIDEDVIPLDASSNKATNFIEKPHFSSQQHSILHCQNGNTIICITNIRIIIGIPK